MPKDLYEVRASSIEGRGVFAVKPIAKGRRVGEYRGERIDDAEASRRYDHRPDGKTYLFTVADDRLIDAEVRGNDIRFINHSCAPNCASTMDNGRVYIDATKNITPGDELTYDYRLEIDDVDVVDAAPDYPCHCGSPRCRGTMLWIPTNRRGEVLKNGATKPRS